jgi:organic hydroperoxide reductase OsmC/OhrA
MGDTFTSQLWWSGATKGATTSPATFSRDLEVTVDGRTLPMSSAPGYRGDASRLNPEQLFVAALSACQALTFLFLAAKNGVAVVGYTDDASGVLGMVAGHVRMSHVTLRPRITLVHDSDTTKARGLVERAHHDCFIGNSVSTDVSIEPTFDPLDASSPVDPAGSAMPVP